MDDFMSDDSYGSDYEDGFIDDDFLFSPLGMRARHLGSVIARFSDRRRRGRADTPTLLQVGTRENLLDLLFEDQEDPELIGDEDRSGNLPSLLESCAKIVAKHYSCEQLENSEPPLDEALLKKVAFWAFPQDEHQVQAYANLSGDHFSNWTNGLGLIREDRIREMWQVGFMATAYLNKFPASATTAQAAISGVCEDRVSLTFEKQRILSSTCSECRNQVWCHHVIAAVVYRIRNAHKVKVHAPVTETLSTLDRNQLQKLLQYAIQEDPAGILGKVFKHLDAIRDSNSEINALAGAPDPTFGGIQGSKTQWQLSLEKMKKNLGADLDRMTNFRLYDYRDRTVYYPNGYDHVSKTESRMFRYIQKVLDLVHQKEAEAAAQVLIQIIKTVMHHMEEITHVESPSLSRFCHDLAHIYAKLLLYSTSNARNILIAATSQLQRQSSRLSPGHLLPESSWAELPSIVPVYEQKLAKDSKNGHFTEALCAELVQPWPVELEELLSGAVSVEESTYDEELRVMLARLDSIFHLANTKVVYVKMARLASKIIRKLAGTACKESIIGAYLDHLGQDSIMARNLFRQLGIAPESFHSASTPVDVSVATAVPSTSKGKSLRSRRGPPAKKFKRSHNPESSSTTTSRQTALCHEQVSYCMLYLCQAIIRSQEMTKQQLESQPHLVGFCLLALELSRKRAVVPKDVVGHAEHDCLYRLENSICEFLGKAHGRAGESIRVYLDALKTIGCRFYNNEYPVVLMDMLMFLVLKNETVKNECADDIVRICADFITDSPKPLDKFTLPTSSPLDLVFESLSDSDSFRRRHKDFVQNKFNTIIDTFFSQLDTDKKEHVTLGLKVIQHVENYDNGEILRRITKALRLHIAKLEKDPALVEGALRVLIHALKVTNHVYLTVLQSNARDSDIEFILSLAKRIGVPSLKLFIGKWQDFFRCSNVKRLMTTLESQIRATKTLPKEAVQMIMQYYEADQMHGDDACDLLSFFKFGDSNYHQAARKMCENAKYYTVNSLFELAKQQISVVSGKKARNEAWEKEVFSIVEKALENLEYISPYNNKLSFSHFDWLCEQFASPGFATGSKQKESLFSRMVQVLEKYCKNHPGVLLRILQNIEKSPNLVKQSAPLGDLLLKAYGRYFDDRLHECGHGAYATVINEMHRARMKCKQYTKNGEARFDLEVIKPIRTFHSGKKKLLRMLDIEFSEKTARNTNAK